jgi:DNA-directed RNA polymerase subunit RPC12/RpoP
MAKNLACWGISLETTCPKCDHDFDMLNDSDFCSSSIRPIEHDTERTTDYEVTCPKCRHEFLVDFQY